MTISIVAALMGAAGLVLIIIGLTGSDSVRAVTGAVLVGSAGVMPPIGWSISARRRDQALSLTEADY